jgi:hypothetical protein
MQVDFLITELEGFALNRRCAADKGLKPHTQYTCIEVYARRFVCGSQNEMV